MPWNWRRRGVFGGRPAFAASFAMARLILLRHGESQWNATNRFTGWADVDLTAAGEAQALWAGRLLAAHELRVATAFTSVLTRAIRTLWIALHASGQAFVPEHKTWRLNERHYGGLTGLDKTEAAKRFGAEQVARWRRGYADRPPPMNDPEHARLQADRRYRDTPVPRTESLKDVVARLGPWRAELDRALEAGPVLVVAHGNSLRALVSQLLRLDPAQVPGFEIPLANPLLMELDADGRAREPRYLDADRAARLPHPA